MRKMGFRVCSAIPILMRRIKTGRARHVITVVTLNCFTSWAKSSTVQSVLSSSRKGNFGYLFQVSHMAVSNDSAAQTVKEINFEDVRALLNNNSIILIDVREPKELREDGAIPKSVNIPLGDIKGAFSLSSEKFQEKYGIPLPSKNSTDVVLSCRSGRRATKAVEELYKMGYMNARCYCGSFLDWVAKGGEVVKM